MLRQKNNMEKISDIMESNYSSYKEMTEKSEAFKKGVELFRNGKKINLFNSVGTKWVKKAVSPKEWNSLYKNINSYCFLRKENGMVVIGFCAANEVPKNCELLTDDEAIQVSDYRKAFNIYPLPLENEVKTQANIEYN